MIAALWKVHSETGRDFMSEFSKGLAGGASLLEALRQARLKMRSEKPHPYYWAPFILVGQWR